MTFQFTIIMVVFLFFDAMYIYYMYTIIDATGVNIDKNTKKGHIR